MAVSRMKFGLVAAAGLLLSALLVVACTSTPSKSSTPPTSLPLSTTSVASSTTTSVPASPEGLVILLTENSSQAGYYVDGWQGYNEPLFALWPDFRMMVRVAGGYKGEPPVYEEAMLTFPEVAQLRTWAAAADLSTLKDTYTLAGGFSDPLVWQLEVGNTQSAKAVTFERYPFPTDEPGYPARLKTFVDQLMNYRPPELLYVFGKLGVSLPHSSLLQSTAGSAVPLDQLQPGDLLFFYNPVHHVGIYVGDGNMIDAPGTGAFVRIEKVWTSNLTGVRRMFTEPAP